MRRQRIYGVGIESPVYHTMSRAVDGRQIFKSDEEKEQLRTFLADQCAFSGLELLTFCIMSNHFHCLLRTPVRPDKMSEKEILSRLARVKRKTGMQVVRDRLARFRKQGNEEAADELLLSISARMYDVSDFMKAVKQQYGRYYNAKEGRRGTLWGERFKSNLVQDGEALQTLAAYIDLGPVRAGLVKKVGAWQWCGYTEAVQGSREARNGIRQVMRTSSGRLQAWPQAEPRYRAWLVLQGGDVLQRDGRIKRKGLPGSKVQKAFREGQNPIGLDNTGVFGSAEFIMKIKDLYQGSFGQERVHLPHPVDPDEEDGLCTMIRRSG